MRLKYYLRGIGIGIIFTTLLLSVSFYFGQANYKKEELTDQEIIQRATELGMVMADEQGTEDNTKEDSNIENDTELEESADDTSIGNKESTDEDLSLDDAIEAEKDSEPSSDTTVTYVPFTINSGESSDMVAAKLYKAGLVNSADEFNSYMNKLGVDDRIQAGTFYVQENSTYDDLISLLVNKDIRTTSNPESN